jgi:DNA-binding LacI/PurR family transcriptional regulator
MPGQRKTGKKRPPTSADIARRVGISRAAVSYALNNSPGVSQETRSRVHAAAEELGYTRHALASSLRAGRSPFILMPTNSTEITPISTEFKFLIALQLTKRGYTPISHLDRTIGGVQAAQLWAELRPLAVIIEAERLTSRSLDILRRAGTDVVIGLTRSRRPNVDVPTLLSDQRAVGACAARYIVGKGHREIAIVMPRDPNQGTTARERLHGFRQVCGPRAVTVEPMDLGFDQREAQLLARSLMRRSPSAVYAFSDEYALLIMRALQDEGVRVPQDIAVVGCDDQPMCTFLNPRLTSIRLDVAKAAVDVAEMADAMIRGCSVEKRTVLHLNPTVVERESC